MYALSYWNDLANWKRIAASCFGYGNNITSSRFHALKKMVDWRIEFVSRQLDFHGVPHQENIQAMQALSRLCEFAGHEATAGEQQIYLHMFISICADELKAEPTEPKHKWDDGKDFDELSPPEDSPDYLKPPADIGEISF
jgi:hypothetical protein